MSFEGDDHRLSEMENSNLRKHLLWAAQFLTPPQRIELRDRIKGPIEQGGVVEDMAADDREAEIERNRAIERLTDHVEVAVKRGANDHWIAKADELANQLRGHMHDLGPLTFHELHNPGDADPEPQERKP